MKKFIFVFLAFVTVISSQYKVERIINGGAEKFGEVNKEIFNVYAAQQKLYSVERILNYDDPFSEAELFDDGSLVIVNSFLNKIDFYSNLGELISTVNQIDEEKFSYEKTVYVDADKENAALLISNEKSSQSRIEIYSKFGNKLNEINVEGSKGNGILLDEDLNLLIYSTIDWDNTELQKYTSVADTKGNIKLTVNNTFSNGLINKNIFAGFSNKSLLIINLENNQIIENIETIETIITDLIISNDHVYYIESDYPQFKNYKWVYSNSSVNSLSTKNNLTKQIYQIVEEHENAELSIDKNVILTLDNKKRLILD
jgi:hypothetical protein